MQKQIKYALEAVQAEIKLQQDKGTHGLASTFVMIAREHLQGALEKLGEGEEKGEERASENSLRTVASHVKDSDNYVLCVVTGDKDPMTVVVESEKSANVYKELVKRLFDIQYEISGYEPDVAVDRVQSYVNEIRAEWLSENSPEEQSHAE